MVVVDTLHPTLDQDGWLAGPLWIMRCSNMSTVDDSLFFSGFESTAYHADKRAPRPPGALNLVLKMASSSTSAAYGTAPGTTAQSCFPYSRNSTSCPTPNDLYTTAFTKTRLKADVPMVFATVFSPSTAQTPEQARALAKGIRVDIGTMPSVGSLTQISVKLFPSTTVIKMNISSDDSWSVIRTATSARSVPKDKPYLTSFSYTVANEALMWTVDDFLTKDEGSHQERPWHNLLVVTGNDTAFAELSKKIWIRTNVSLPMMWQFDQSNWDVGNLASTKLNLAAFLARYAQLRQQYSHLPPQPWGVYMVSDSHTVRRIRLLTGARTNPTITRAMSRTC